MTWVKLTKLMNHNIDEVGNIEWMMKSIAWMKSTK